MGSGLQPYVSRIDLSRYDRAPSLTVDELRIAQRWAEGAVITRRQLPRLYAPLADVLLHDGADRVNRLRSVKLVLTEVGRSGQAYWAWDERRWLDLIDQRPASPTLSMMPQMTALAYLLGGVRGFYGLKRNITLAPAARLVFGADLFDRECGRVVTALQRVGFKRGDLRSFMPALVAAVALEGGDPRLESFDKALLERVRALYQGHRISAGIAMLANGLAALGLSPNLVRFRLYTSRRGTEPDDIHPDWMEWCRRWLETSTLLEGSRRAVYNTIMRIGIWLKREHPEVTGPGEWTVDTCAAFLAAVDKQVVGSWAGSAFDYRGVPTTGKPLSPSSKVAVHQALRRFMADVQNWEWVKLRCNPRYHLSTPTSVRRLLPMNPRTIDDAVWLKLTWASLNLEASDFLRDARHPLEMVRAMAVIWTHAGLRSNEVVRLRLGCARPHGDDLAGSSDSAGQGSKLCWLDVPAGKNGTAYTKPVNAVVLREVEAWAQLRPVQRPLLDRRTGEQVDYLFQLRGRPVGRRVLNDTIIPMLCAKAGVALEDSMGRITSHRGRASAVTMLASVPNGMNLFELSKWCGHRDTKAIMSYVRSRPTQLATAFAKADQSAHMIQVVVDQAVITAGAARDGTPWKYYDLGDSYCSNAFWSTCPHRMACAGCFFNIPKASAKGQALEAQRSAARLLEEVWLSPDERVAVEGDLTALEGMLAKLQDVPALDGRTPGQIMSDQGPDIPP